MIWVNFEGAVPSVLDQVLFVFIELAGFIELREFRGSSWCIGLAMLFEVHDFAGEPREDVQEAGVFQRIVLELFFQSGGGEVADDVEVLAGEHLERPFCQAGGVVFRDHVTGGLTIGADQGEAFLIGEILLITGPAPIRDVHLRDRIGENRFLRFLQCFDDFASAVAVIEHGVNAIAKGAWKLPDFAMAVLFCLGGCIRDGRLRQVGYGRDEIGGGAHCLSISIQCSVFSVQIRKSFKPRVS